MITGYKSRTENKIGEFKAELYTNQLKLKHQMISDVKCNVKHI